jgi:hypothetical protein
LVKVQKFGKDGMMSNDPLFVKVREWDGSKWQLNAHRNLGMGDFLDTKKWPPWKQELDDVKVQFTPTKMWSISLVRPVYLNVFECIWIDSSEVFQCAAPGMVRCFHGPVAPCFWCLAISSAKFLGFRIPDSGPGMGNPRKPVGTSLRGCYPPVIYG